MCGIVGIWSAAELPPSRLAECESALARLEHRGPDHAASRSFPNAVLGGARLSIVDPGPEANQPLADHTGRWWIVFNGEIYNFIELRDELRGLGHQFLTSSDTEVIVEAYKCWGIDCQARFNGMWAFAIYDARERSLFLSRDRYGIKPLYWADAGGDFVFASEAKALFPFHVSPDPNWQLIGRYLTTGLIRDEDGLTVFRNVQYLPTGHCMWRTPGGDARLEPWWSTYERLESVPRQFAERTERLGELCEDAVRLRLRNDVASGVTLSGGIDSSWIYGSASRLEQQHALRAATLSESAGNLKAFSVSYPGSVFDEYPRVALSLKLWNGEQQFQRVLPRPSDVAQLTEHAIWHQDEPLASPAILAMHRLYQHVAASGVRVILEGHGGDELFAGYASYARKAVGAYLARGRVDLACQAAACYARASSTPAFIGLKSPWRILAQAGWKRLLLRIGKQRRRPAGEPSATDFASPEISAAGLPERNGTASRRASLDAELRREVLHGALPYFLRIFDRATMAYGVESTPPLLDHRLAQFALALPIEDKVTWVTKRILRKAAEGLVPDGVIRDAGKMPFSAPLPEWFAAPEVHSYLADVFHSRAALESDLFDGPRLRDFVDRKTAGGFSRRDIHETWRMLNLHLWHRRFC